MIESRRIMELYNKCHPLYEKQTQRKEIRNTLQMFFETQHFLIVKTQRETEKYSGPQNLNNHTIGLINSVSYFAVIFKRTKTK